MLYLEDEKPVILLVSESNLYISTLITDYLKSNFLDVETINPDQTQILEDKDFFQQKKRVYKIIFIYGFGSTSGKTYEKVFNLFDFLNKKQKEEIPIIFLSKISLSLNLLDNFNAKYKTDLKNQNSFINDFLNRFSNSMVFLSQDLLIIDKKPDYPLLLAFSAVEQNYLFDLQTNFYFQDENSFFELIKESLIKPHKQTKFVIRGPVFSSEKLLNDLVYLYEQYFQKKLVSIKLFSDEKPQKFLQEFVFVNNSKVQIKHLLDQIVRKIPDIRDDLSSIAPSQLELKKAFESSQKNELKQVKKMAAETSKSIIPDNPSELIIRTQKEPLESPKIEILGTELNSKIEAIFSSARKKEKDIRQQKNIYQGKEIIKKSKKRKIVFWIGIIGSSIGFVFLGLLFIFKTSKAELERKMYRSVKDGNYINEKINQTILYKFFDLQLTSYKKLFSEDILKEDLDLKKLGTNLSNLSASLVQVNETNFRLYKKTLESGVDLKSFYDDLVLAIDKKLEAQKSFNSYLMDLNLDLYQGQEKNVWQMALNDNKEQLKESIQFKKFFLAFKNFIFQSGRVNFLILIQDGGEIRSSGGLLTDLFLLSFDNGVLVDKQVLDVSDIDQRIYGHRESDQEIKEILGENSFYLHDANWQADFAKSNQEIKWFVEQATGSKIDLTMAVNTKTIFKILKALNGLELPDKVLVDQSNYSEKLEAAASLDYKNIGDKKFTSQFANELLKKLLLLNAEQFAALSNLLIKDLNEKEILLQTSHQELQKTIEANSWSGGRVAISCPAEFKQDHCILDSLFQLENNVGINKINPYINETIEHNLGIGKDFIRHKRKIIFENLSKSDVWPQGTYRNYLKFFLNNLASLEKIELNGKKLDEKNLKIIDTDENKEISVLLEIPKQSRIELIITYLVPNQIKPPFSYVFFDQKQPGIFAKKTTYNIVFDEQFKPQLIAPQAVYQDKTIHFENTNLDHFLFAISFNE